jgi:hypothetical protein
LWTCLQIARLPIFDKNCLESPLKPKFPAGPGTRIAWRGLAGSGRGLAIAAAAAAHGGPLLAITASSFAAQRLEDEIRFYAPELPILPFPDWESLPYDVFSPHQDIISQRLETLHRLPDLTQGVVLASVTTLLHRLPPRDYVSAHSFLLKTGDRLDIQRLREQLTRANYHSVSQVMEASLPCAAGWWICSRPAATSPIASTCSAIRWSPSASSMSRRSARENPSKPSACCRRANTR